MAFELREGSGYIFTVQKRTENSPILRGECLIGGVAYEVAIWPERDGKKGQYFTTRPKEERQPPKPRPVVPDDDQDIPF